VVQVTVGAVIGYRNAMSPNRLSVTARPQTDPLTAIAQPTSRGVIGGIAVLFGLAGVVVLLREGQPSGEKVSFNV